MPYIVPKQREALDAYVDALIAHIKESNFEVSYLGQLNYAMTRLLLGTFRAINGPLRYWQVTAIMGTLSSMSIEIYRRLVGPYENHQQELNGDIKEFQPEIEKAPEPRKPRGQLTD